MNRHFLIPLTFFAIMLFAVPAYAQPQSGTDNARGEVGGNLDERHDSDQQGLENAYDRIGDSNRRRPPRGNQGQNGSGSDSNDDSNGDSGGNSGGHNSGGGIYNAPRENVGPLNFRYNQ